MGLIRDEYRAHDSIFRQLFDPTTRAQLRLCVELLPDGNFRVGSTRRTPLVSDASACRRQITSGNNHDKYLAAWHVAMVAARRDRLHRKLT